MALTPKEIEELAVAAAIRAAKSEVEEAAERAAVAAIKVTVSGKVFDGDEVAQGRMARAVAAAESAAISTYQWKLADNSVAAVSLDELKQALALAFQAQSELWV